MNIDYNELIHYAKLLARHAHYAQLYGDKDYFEYHVEGVVSSIQKVTSDPVLIIVGLLHDVVEDSVITIDYIKHYFGSEIAEAVDAITKRGDETRDDYLIRCRSNSIAHFVKIHDAEFNLAESKKENNTKRIEYYKDTIQLLNNMNI